MADTQPRRFKLGEVALICNFAEIIMRMLEGQVMQLRPSSNVLKGKHSRGPAAYQQAFAVVEANANGWPILASTPSFDEMAGQSDASTSHLSTHHVWGIIKRFAGSIRHEGLQDNWKLLFKRQTRSWHHESCAILLCTQYEGQECLQSMFGQLERLTFLHCCMAFIAEV